MAPTRSGAPHQFNALRASPEAAVADPGPSSAAAPQRPDAAEAHGLRPRASSRASAEPGPASERPRAANAFDPVDAAVIDMILDHVPNRGPHAGALAQASAALWAKARPKARQKHKAASLVHRAEQPAPTARERAATLTAVHAELGDLDRRELTDVLEAVAAGLGDVSWPHAAPVFDKVLTSLESLGVTRWLVTDRDPVDRREAQRELDLARLRVFDRLAEVPPVALHSALPAPALPPNLQPPLTLQMAHQLADQMAQHAAQHLAQDEQPGTLVTRLVNFMNRVETPALRNQMAADMKPLEGYDLAVEWPALGTDPFDAMLDFVQDKADVLSDEARSQSIVKLASVLLNPFAVEEDDRLEVMKRMLDVILPMPAGEPRESAIGAVTAKMDPGLTDEEQNSLIEHAASFRRPLP